MTPIAALAHDYTDLRQRVDAHLDDHTPGAIWRRAERAARADLPRSRAWKARFLDLDPVPLHNAIALGGMAPLLWEDAWHLAVALPQPIPLAVYPQVEDVLLIARDGRAQMLGDPGVAYIAPARQLERLAIRTDAKAWARDLALKRLEWWGMRRERARLLQAQPTWYGDPDTALILGPLSKVRWSDFHATVIEVPADLRADVHRAVYQQARLPRIEGRA